MLTPFALSIWPVSLFQLKPMTLNGICPWSWYMATHPSYFPHFAFANNVSGGIGPSTSYPFKRSSSIAGMISFLSSSPKSPLSLA